jgi:hypothetical protein
MCDPGLALPAWLAADEWRAAVCMDHGSGMGCDQPRAVRSSSCADCTPLNAGTVRVGDQLRVLRTKAAAAVPAAAAAAAA